MSKTPSYQDKIVSETNEHLEQDVVLTPEHASRTIDFMIKQMQGLVEGHTAERTSLIRELVDCHKEIDRMRNVLHRSRVSRFKIYIKKILVGLGWYEVSKQELQLIHEQDFGAIK